MSGLVIGACGGDAEGVDSDGDTLVAETQDVLFPCDLAPVFWTRYQFHLVSVSGAALPNFEGTLGFRHADSSFRTTLECPPDDGGGYATSYHRCGRVEGPGASMVDGTGTVNYLAHGHEGELVEFEVLAKNGERFEGAVEFVEGTVPQEGSIMECHNLSRVLDVTIQLEEAP